MWRERPDSRPDHSPDLAVEVRPEMDRLTGKILLALKALDRG
jgi:hypothetical protein